MTSDGLIRRPDDLPADWTTSVLPGGHEAFAAQLSGEPALCKSDPEIFAPAVTRLGLLAPQCVFDDFEVNVGAAVHAGLRAVLHPRTEDTTRRLAELFG